MEVYDSAGTKKVEEKKNHTTAEFAGHKDSRAIIRGNLKCAQPPGQSKRRALSHFLPVTLVQIAPPIVLFPPGEMAKPSPCRRLWGHLMRVWWPLVGQDRAPALPLAKESLFIPPPAWSLRHELYPGNAITNCPICTTK